MMSLYDGWAPFYDRLLGAAGFEHIWPAFRHAICRFGMQITSAADFGCGTGLFLAALARMLPDAPLFGVDRSAPMLRQAARRLAGLHVRLFQGDLRSFRLAEPVDLVTCNFATLNYTQTNADLASSIDNLMSNLRIRGYLVIDFLVAGGSTEDRAFVQRITLPTMVAQWHIQSLGGNNKGRVVMRNCRRGAQRWRCWTETHEQRWWPLRDMLDQLCRVGVLPLAAIPLGGVPSSRGGRWIQVVAQRT